MYACISTPSLAGVYTPYLACVYSVHPLPGWCVHPSLAGVHTPPWMVRTPLPCWCVHPSLDGVYTPPWIVCTPLDGVYTPWLVCMPLCVFTCMPSLSWTCLLICQFINMSFPCLSMYGLSISSIHISQIRVLYIFLFACKPNIYYYLNFYDKCPFYSFPNPANLYLNHLSQTTKNTERFREAAKKGSSLNGRAIKRGRVGVKGRAIKKKINCFGTFFPTFNGN